MDNERPFLGASSDGIISCECCDKGVLEVKCPFSNKEGLPYNLDKAGFFMSRQDDRWTWKRDHAYHYQIQQQLQVCQLHTLL